MFILDEILDLAEKAIKLYKNFKSLKKIARKESSTYYEFIY